MNLASLHDLFLSTSGLASERRVLHRVLLVPEARVTCPDACLTRSAPHSGPRVSSPEVLGTRRGHGGNASRRDRKTFGLPVVAPAINAFPGRHNRPVRFGGKSCEVIRGPLPQACGRGLRG